MSQFEFLVRYYECDPQGVAFNGVYYNWADVGSFAFWRDTFGGYDRVEAAGVDTVVVASQAVFRASVRPDDLVEGRTALTHVGTTSFELTTDLSNAGRSIAEVKVRFVFVDRETGAKTEPPDEIKAAFSQAAFAQAA